MTPTLKTQLWVTAQIRTMNAHGMFAFVVHRGDADRGGILLKRAPLDGSAVLYERALDFAGQPVWRRIGGETPAPEEDIDSRINRRLAHDSDIWVIEVEDPLGNLVLDAPLERLT